MKTSKEMQLKILDKMRDNVENDLNILEDIEYYNYHFNEWRSVSDITRRGFDSGSYRVKPSIIIINGVEIPKPLGLFDLEDKEYYYLPSSIEGLHEEVSGSWCNCFKPKFTYKTKEEAIEASKMLFGIEG